MKKFVKIIAVALVCVLAVAALVACAPNSDPDKAKAALEKKGYSVLKVGGFGSVICTLTASNVVTDKDGHKKMEFVHIKYYSSAAEAKKAFEDVKKEADKDKNKDESDWTVACSGAVIYYGTKAAIKASVL